MQRRAGTGGKSTKRRTPADMMTGFKSLFLFIFLISGVVNILALTGSLYMMQVYDRALPSQSMPTLLALSLLAVGLYGFQGILDVIRSRITVRMGAKVDEELSPLAHRVAVDMPRFGFSTTESLERGRDVDTLRSFLGSTGLIALFDFPWLPVYLLFVYMLHPSLGLLVFVGAILMAALTLVTELLTRNHAQDSLKSAIKRGAIADSNARNADVLRAMGIVGRAVRRYQLANLEHLKQQTKATDIGGTLSGIAKVVRMILQSAVLGLGAYLTIRGEMSAGAIIAATVAATRALSPVDMIIGQWKNMVSARRSYSRLGDTLTALEANNARVHLPAPHRSLKVENITVAVPSTGAVVVGDVSFELKAGSGLGLIGPTGGGKSTLVKALVDVWPVVRGHVRIDGAELKQWDPEELGRYIGYLPQDISLLEGTVAENIARFDPDATSEKIVAAAQAAGVHDMIVQLPNGYQTELGSNGAALSGGQRQRIGLARALYGDPFIVVLDEPNSNLDADGDAALTTAMQSVRGRGGIVVVVAHRPSALIAVNLVGVMQEGRLVSLGPVEEILQKQQPRRPGAAPIRPAAIG